MNINLGELEEKIKNRLETLDQEKLRLLEQLKVVHKTVEIAAAFEAAGSDTIDQHSAEKVWKDLQSDEAPA